MSVSVSSGRNESSSDGWMHLVPAFVMEEQLLGCIVYLQWLTQGAFQFQWLHVAYTINNKMIGHHIRKLLHYLCHCISHAV